VDGSCQCASGLFGELCEHRCLAGTWGPDCIKKCKCRSGVSTCSAVDGRCDCQVRKYYPETFFKFSKVHLNGLIRFGSVNFDLYLLSKLILDHRYPNVDQKFSLFLQFCAIQQKRFDLSMKTGTSYLSCINSDLICESRFQS
jgi:hypothetical protein